MPDSIEPFLTPSEIAKLLKVSPETVIGWIRNGELRAVNVGSGTRRSRFRVSRENLDEFLCLREVQPPAPRQRRRRRTESTQGGPIDPVEGKKLAKQGLAREISGKYYRVVNGVTQWV
ncbi:helix-turn-helix domain-containing protein [Stieleria sp. JC731]|uniref:helix-turn-helix domain-containing protein n=1 Tax=Pirellulaceae TaxID=2691357 RepID=UPI00396582BD